MKHTMLIPVQNYGWTQIFIEIGDTLLFVYFGPPSQDILLALPADTRVRSKNKPHHVNPRAELLLDTNFRRDR